MFHGGHEGGRPAKGAPAVEAIGLVKRFGRVRALDGFTLRVAPGEVVAVLGPSGCGKSTAIRCIGGLLPPDAGEVRLFGQPLYALGHRELLAARAGIGFVFQHYHLIERLTALDNVALGLVLRGVPRRQARLLAAAALDRVGLLTAADRLPTALSGGERQRVAIARALAARPRLMLWDEPTAALDPLAVREVLLLMEQLVEEFRTTMVIVTHEVAFARRAARRVVLVDGGRVVESGSPEQVFAAPRSEVGRRYRRLFAS